jgi:PAS domain-containing protein
MAEYQQLEEALQSCEEKFSKAFRESPLILALSSAGDHRYIDVNDTFERISGWNRNEIGPGRSWNWPNHHEGTREHAWWKTLDRIARKARHDNSRSCTHQLQNYLMPQILRADKIDCSTSFVPHHEKWPSEYL